MAPSLISFSLLGLSAFLFSGCFVSPSVSQEGISESEDLQPVSSPPTPVSDSLLDLPKTLSPTTSETHLSGSELSASQFCDHHEDFNDGPGNSVWKPVSESTGRVILLMNQPYRFSTFQIDVIDRTGEIISQESPRTRCEMNGG